MKRKVLIIASGDPRNSGSVAEAVRIAAGLSAHERLDVTFCFHNAAAEVLRVDSEDLVDGDLYADYLPVLAGSGMVLTTGVVANAPTSVPVRRITPDELRTLAASVDRVLGF